MLVDFEGLRLAPRARDLATYAADVVGAGGDIRAVVDVSEPLLEGYARRPEAFNWYLATEILKGSPRPFSRQVADWPSGIEAIVHTAQEALDL